MFEPVLRDYSGFGEIEESKMATLQSCIGENLQAFRPFSFSVLLLNLAISNSNPFPFKLFFQSFTIGYFEPLLLGTIFLSPSGFEIAVSTVHS